MRDMAPSMGVDGVTVMWFLFESSSTCSDGELPRVTGVDRGRVSCC
jgi:hypothetical protein